mgnify:CR=1 FL=1
MRDCVKTAQDMIDSGAAMAKMEEFIQATKKAAGEVKGVMILDTIARSAGKRVEQRKQVNRWNR